MAPVPATFTRIDASGSTTRLQHPCLCSSYASTRSIQIPNRIRKPSGSISANLTMDVEATGARNHGFLKRRLLPTPLHGYYKVKSKTSSTLSSVLVGTSTAHTDVTFQRFEEEHLEGCSLLHGQMIADDVRIHFVEAGDPAGKLVILVHGWPNFWYVWKYQFRALVEAGYHVVAPDLRGYNTSSKPESLLGCSRSSILSDIEKLIDHFGGGKPAIMVGHDWGATISWCFAEDFPNKLERLVTSNMGRLNDFQDLLTSDIRQLLMSWHIGFWQVPYISNWLLEFDNLRFIRSKLASGGPIPTDEDIRRHVEAFRNPGAIEGGLSLYRAAFQGLWNRPDGKVPVVRIPVTVLWGDVDPFLLPILAETSQAGAPNVTVVRLPKCAHWPMWDDPILFNYYLLKAISGDKI